MQRRKNLIAALACGIVCVAAILLYAKDLHASVEAERAEVLARYGGEQVEVYAATEDIAAGEMVDETNTEKRLWVGELLVPDAVSDLADVRGKTLASPVYRGEAVSMRRFSGDEAATPQVPEGLCAVSVAAKPVSAVGGSVTAGSRVDVYAASAASTDLLASSVLVLSTSATSSVEEAGNEDVSWVTLAIKPDLVEEVIAAAQVAELYFSLPSETLDRARDASGVAGDGADSAADTSSGIASAEGGSSAGDDPAADEEKARDGGVSSSGDGLEDADADDAQDAPQDGEGD